MPFLSTRVDTRLTIKYLESLPEDIKRNARKAIGTLSKELTTFVKYKYLSGASTRGIKNTSHNRLATMSGALRSGTRAMATFGKGGLVGGGVFIGGNARTEKYAHLHIADSPKQTKIRPTGGRKFLAIPTMAARNGNRTIKPEFDLSHRSLKDIPDMQKRKSKRGAYIVGKTDESGKWITYYILKNSIIVKSRVHTVDIVREYTPKANRVMSKAIGEAL